MPRPSRSAVAFCIAIVALAALMPGIGVLACALVEPQWILLPEEVFVVLSVAVPRTDEHPGSLFPVVSPRAPPFQNVQA
jgi:hypothetical protein